MTARSLLVRGLVAGLLAGVLAFVVAYELGEPHVEAAIALEEAGHSHGHAGEGAEVSRADQRTWGLLTGSLAVGTALGGIVALVSAAVMGRLGRLRPGQSTAAVAVIGFVAMALVPFLKYPATPPAVGGEDTIGERTAYYFGFLLISVAAAVAATAAAQRIWARAGTYAAVLTGLGGYLVVVVPAGVLMPTVNELGDFPADTLWSFRIASLVTLATIWAAIGVILTGLVGRLHSKELQAAARRRLAAAL